MSDSARKPGSNPPPREDLDWGLQFTHFLGMQLKEEARKALAAAYALVEEMVATGQIDLRSFETRRERLHQKEAARAEKEARVQLGDPVDKYTLENLPVIDCEARLPLCRARCCAMVFPLSQQDLRERIVEWEYSRPYQIRRKADGYCVHNDPSKKGCQVYQNRPAICRTYDCRRDARVWIDFEKRIPAPFEGDK